MVALEQPYEVFLAANGGVEKCGICGKDPTDKRLDRDHDHKTGKPRGLLCHRCNRDLGVRATQEWLEAALAYVSDR
jgi:Recombination endonuclease VII